jgi:hypothetical protein
LNGTLKNDVVKHLQSLCNNGHTVIVVSHDEVFYDYGRQLELKNGDLKEISPNVKAAKPEKQKTLSIKSPTPKTLSIKSPTPTENLLGGWKPRASMVVLFNQIIHETLSRPIFLSLILIALIVGICQVSVFSSVIIGVQNYVDDAMTTGSRLNRV